jgi:predicted Fe-S protein YdhL (DUF1289 family)
LITWRIAFPVVALILASDSPERIMAIDSPCTKVCIIHAAKGLCLGCGRSLSEIAAWSSLSGQDRTRLMADLPRRLAVLPQPPVPPHGP